LKHQEIIGSTAELKPQ